MGGFPNANRKARGLGKTDTFDFLGFTFYCSQDVKKTFFRVKVKSSNKKMISKLKKMKVWIKERKHWSIQDLIDSLNRSLNGYYNYYCVTDNIPYVQKFRFQIIGILFKWLNRRSQMRSYNWQEYKDLLKAHPIVSPRIKVSLF